MKYYYKLQIRDSKGRLVAELVLPVGSNFEQAELSNTTFRIHTTLEIR